MAQTLHIKVLGFSSGRTGWVITDGKPPYEPGTVTPAGEAGIIDRFCEDGRKELAKLVTTVEEVKMVAYGSVGELVSVTKEQALEALEGDPLCDDDRLCDLGE